MRVCQQVREKLGCDAILMQLPIGVGEAFQGVVDLVAQEAIYFDGANGEDVRREPVPADISAAVATARATMLESLAMYSDELMELLLSEEEVPLPLIHSVLRDCVQNAGCHADLPGLRVSQ